MPSDPFDNFRGYFAFLDRISKQNEKNAKKQKVKKVASPDNTVQHPDQERWQAQQAAEDTMRRQSNAN